MWAAGVPPAAGDAPDAGDGAEAGADDEPDTRCAIEPRCEPAERELANAKCAWSLSKPQENRNCLPLRVDVRERSDRRARRRAQKGATSVLSVSVFMFLLCRLCIS